MVKLIDNNSFEKEIKEGVTFVDFYADWCGPCKMSAPVIDEMSNEIDGVNFAKVDVDQSPELAAQFSVRSIPTFMIFKDGEKVNSVSGFNGKPSLLSLIEQSKQKALLKFSKTLHSALTDKEQIENLRKTVYVTDKYVMHKQGIIISLRVKINNVWGYWIYFNEPFENARGGLSKKRFIKESNIKLVDQFCNCFINYNV